MLKVLKERDDFIKKMNDAIMASKKDQCTKYLAYVARSDCFKVSDWFDDATIMAFYVGEEVNF